MQKNIKAILFDLDGVVIRKKERLFSERFSEEFNIPIEKVLEFFTGDFRECSFGRADLKEKVAPYLKEWNYSGTVDDFLKFWFEEESNIDQNVLEIIDELRLDGIKCYIATRQEKYRKEYLLNEVGLKDHFDGIFCTCDIGYDKWQIEYWDYVLKNLKLKPEEIVFFCDTEKNIITANSFGINAYLWKDVNSMKESLKKLK